MIATGRSYFEQWWIGAFPGLAILSVALAFNIVGDTLRDLLDPRSRMPLRDDVMVQDPFVSGWRTEDDSGPRR